jgi:hypothetical protein
MNTTVGSSEWGGERPLLARVVTPHHSLLTQLLS